MFSFTPRQIADLVLAALLIIAGYLSYHTVSKWKAGYDANKANTATATAVEKSTSAVVADFTNVTDGSRAREAGVDQARQQYIVLREELHNANPTVASFDDAPVPDELRQLARARREARERLGGHAAGGQRSGEAEAAGPGPDGGRP